MNNEFLAVLQKWNITLTEYQVSQFERYYDVLTERNKVVNLTRITEVNEVYTKHFLDSLSICKINVLKDNQSLIDVGSGAGFPGIPLKIVYPNLKLSLIDSSSKRIAFIRDLIASLSLKGVSAVHTRAEELANKNGYRESFDVATARAVASLNTLSEYCMPFVKVGGYFIAMKGSVVKDELDRAKNAMRILGGEKIKIEQLHLPDQMGERNIIFIEKHRSTPSQYPRRAGTPKRDPL